MHSKTDNKKVQMSNLKSATALLCRFMRHEAIHKATNDSNLEVKNKYGIDMNYVFFSKLIICVVVVIKGI